MAGVANGRSHPPWRAAPHVAWLVPCYLLSTNMHMVARSFEQHRTSFLFPCAWGMPHADGWSKGRRWLKPFTCQLCGRFTSTRLRGNSCPRVHFVVKHELSTFACVVVEARRGSSWPMRDPVRDPARDIRSAIRTTHRHTDKRSFGRAPIRLTSLSSPSA